MVEHGQLTNPGLYANLIYYNINSSDDDNNDSYLMFLSLILLGIASCMLLIK